MGKDKFLKIFLDRWKIISRQLGHTQLMTELFPYYYGLFLDLAKKLSKLDTSMNYTQEELVNKLKAEIGLSDIPTEELSKHTVIFNSPVKGDEEMSMTADLYIKNGLKIWHEAVAQLNIDLNDESFKSFKVENEGMPKMLEVPSVEVIPDKLEYYDVAHNEEALLVCVNLAQETGEVDRDMLKGHFTCLGQRAIGDINSTDRVISFYQWYNWQSRLERPVSTGIFELDDFQEKLKFSFQGLEGLDEMKGFLK